MTNVDLLLSCVAIAGAQMREATTDEDPQLPVYFGCSLLRYRLPRTSRYVRPIIDVSNGESKRNLPVVERWRSYLL
jgi:hypothetical protein